MDYPGQGSKEAGARLQKNQARFKYVDLFAGCGGLSLGLESAGGELTLAIERSPMAAETFFRNLVRSKASSSEWLEFRNLDPLAQSQQGLIVSDITSAATFEASRRALENTDIDLVAGGPPCQGFSLAGRRRKDDTRNSLAWDFLKYVALANPKFVLIENVLGMNAKFKSQEENSASIFNQLAMALAETGSGYVVQKLHLNSMHFGAAQSRERLFLLGCRVDIAMQLGLTVSDSVWKSDFCDQISVLPDLAPVPTVRAGEAITLREALGELLPNGKETDYSRNLKDSQFWGLSEAIGLKNVTQRRHGENTQLKFELYIALKNLGLSSKLIKADKTQAETAVRDALKDELRTKVSYPIFKTSGEVLASSPEEFEELLERFKTRKHSQRVLELDKTPPTVITSPDDYLHPLVPRVLSVRELARFQGFSDHFEFYSKETTGGLNRRTEVPQYSQVGNAVSPFVSKAFGELFASLLANAV